MLSISQKKILDFAYDYYKQNLTDRIVYTINSGSDLPHAVNALNMLERDGIIKDVVQSNFNVFTFTLTSPTSHYKD